MGVPMYVQADTDAAETWDLLQFRFPDAFELVKTGATMGDDEDLDILRLLTLQGNAAAARTEDLMRVGRMLLMAAVMGRRRYPYLNPPTDAEIAEFLAAAMEGLER